MMGNIALTEITGTTNLVSVFLTHQGPVTHICVGNLTIIGSDNGLSPGRRQAIIWTNAAILLIGPLGTNFSEISIEMQTFSFKKMRLKVSSAAILPRPQCVNSLRPGDAYMHHEKWLSFPEWRIYVSKLLYFSYSARESLVKQLLASMS